MWLCFAAQTFATQTTTTTSVSIPTAPQGRVKTKALKASPLSVADSITIKNAWARPSLTTQKDAPNNAAIYLEIINNSNTDYNLIGWESPEITDTVELHLSYVELGNSKMRPVDKLAIPSKSNVILKPLGLHIMLKKCKKNLVVGEKFNLILKFDHNIEKTVPVEVKTS